MRGFVLLAVILAMTSAFTSHYLFADSRLYLVAQGLKRLVIVVVCMASCFLWQGSAVAGSLTLAVSLEPQALSLSQVLPADAISPEMTDASSAASSAATLFEQNCAGCHINGGNVIRRGKNLKKKAMVRNGYGDVDAIAQIITNGKGIMSAYGDRLNGEEIRAIAGYVHEQSESGW